MALKCRLSVGCLYILAYKPNSKPTPGLTLEIQVTSLEKNDIHVWHVSVSLKDEGNLIDLKRKFDLLDFKAENGGLPTLEIKERLDLLKKKFGSLKKARPHEKGKNKMGY